MSKKISLKAARVNAGYSQAAAAKLLNVGKQTLSNWETGRTKINAAAFTKACGIYEISPADIFLPYCLTES